MSIEKLKNDINELINVNDFGKFLLRSWIYKEEVLVLDFIIDCQRYAYDIKFIDDVVKIQLVSRSNNKKEDIKAPKSSKASAIFSVIKSSLATIISKIHKKYEYYISVIVPIYNRENLLQECVKSLNNQTLDKSKFEVIFVDDFSSDNSVEYVKNNIDKKLNYSILERPINSGSASEPRNDGIRSAKGQYLFFLDSDDYIYDYTLSDLYSCAEKNNSDVIYLRIEGDPGRPFGKRPFAQGDIDYATVWDNHLTRSLMPSKMIKYSLVKSRDIYFPIDIKVGEDRVFFIEALAFSNRISILANKPYYYLTNHDSDRLTHVKEPISKSLDIISRTFRSIYFSNYSHGDKKRFFSMWMNTILESYVKLRLKTANFSYKDKKWFFEQLKREFNIYNALHSESEIYPDLKDFYKVFLKDSFEDVYTYCKTL